jgi:hypothetical protein
LRGRNVQLGEDSDDGLDVGGLVVIHDGRREDLLDDRDSVDLCKKRRACQTISVAALKN